MDIVEQQLSHEEVREPAPGPDSWPGIEGTEHFHKGKTYREQDVGELHLLRLLVERAGLIRSAGLWFELTPLGRALLEPGRRGTLQALLFRHAVLGHGPLSLRARPSPWTAQVVAAGRDRRHPLRPVRGGGGLAGCGRAHRVMHDSPTTSYRRRVAGRRPRCSCGGFSGRFAGSGFSRYRGPEESRKTAETIVSDHFLRTNDVRAWRSITT